MTYGHERELRLALLIPRINPPGPVEAARQVRQLADQLRERGVSPYVLRPDPGPLRVADALLRRRGFAGPLSPVPFVVKALLIGRYDVVHTFSAADALAALAWRRITDRPVLFTCWERLGRESLADRRLRLWLLRRAVEDTDAVIAPTREAREALRRWLVVEAKSVAVDDAVGHERLYREVVCGRA